MQHTDELSMSKRISLRKDITMELLGYIGDVYSHLESNEYPYGNCGVIDITYKRVYPICICRSLPLVDGIFEELLRNGVMYSKIINEDNYSCDGDMYRINFIDIDHVDADIVLLRKRPGVIGSYFESFLLVLNKRTRTVISATAYGYSFF